ncbi:hypothetical protein L0152_08365, partial [bacterium]|nr:hypothetical protein [bacterium]
MSELDHEINVQIENLKSNPTSADVEKLVTSFHARIRKLRFESRQYQNQETPDQFQAIRKNLKELKKLNPPKEEIILGKTEPPQNDNCSNAYTIGDGHYIGTLDGASHDGDSDCDEKKQTVWYRYIAPANADVAATVSSSVADLLFSVHDASAGCPGDRSNEITCDDDCDLDWEVTSCVKFHAQAGKEYLLRVNAWDNDGGEFTLNIARPGSLSGQVTDQETATPLSNLDVEIYNSDDYLVAYAYPDSSGY